MKSTTSRSRLVRGSDFLLIDLQYNCMLDYLVVDKVEEQLLKKLSSSGTDDNMLIRHDNT